MNTILHADMNGFYASAECLYHPEYAGIPLAVGGDVENRHGIILAKNEEAKKYNIKTAENFWEAKAKCPNLVIVPPNYDKYISISNQFRRMLLEYSGRVEPFGLDENWIDLGPHCSIDEGRQIADELRERLNRRGAKTPRLIV